MWDAGVDIDAGIILAMVESVGATKAMVVMNGIRVTVVEGVGLWRVSWEDNREGCNRATNKGIVMESAKRKRGKKGVTSK